MEKEQTFPSLRCHQIEWNIEDTSFLTSEPVEKLKTRPYLHFLSELEGHWGIPCETGTVLGKPGRLVILIRCK